MGEMDEFNRTVVEEFRANAGQVGGGFAGLPMILIETKGPKSGKTYTTPLVYLADGDSWYIFASKGGAPTNPVWFDHLKAGPDITIEVGSERFAATATELTGTERDTIYDKQASIMTNFADYAAATTRVIPVFRLTRA